jgi:hypothetical protein
LKSPLHLFAELGDLLAKYAAHPSYAIAMVIVAWIIAPIGALVASLLIAAAYLRAHETREPGAAPAAETPDRGDWLMLIGLVFIAGGAYWLVRDYIPRFTWEITTIALGLLLVLLGLARRGRTTHD